MTLDIDQAAADMEWTMNRARAAMQEATAQLDRVSGWRHPVLYLKLRLRLRQLHRAVGI